MSFSGNDSVSVVVAAMRVKIPQNARGVRPRDEPRSFRYKEQRQRISTFWWFRGMNTSPSSCSSCGSWWRLPLLLGLVLAAILLVRNGGIRHSTTDTGAPSLDAPAVEPAGEAVRLSIDFGDGRQQKYQPIAWREGMTVRDLTRETRRADLKLDVRGTGASAFLANLDGVENEGADGRNWLYSVNGKPGDKSFAIYELEAGDHVLWTFGGPQ
jgi:hypothetical protein